MRLLRGIAGLWHLRIGAGTRRSVRSGARSVVQLALPLSMNIVVPGGCAEIGWYIGQRTLSAVKSIDDILHVRKVDFSFVFFQLRLY